MYRYIFLLFSLIIFCSGCKNSKESPKESSEITAENWKIKNSKLLVSDRYRGSDKSYTIYRDDDLAFLNELSQEEIEEHIENLFFFMDDASSYYDLNLLKQFSHIKSLTFYWGDKIIDISPIGNLENLEELIIYKCNGINDIPTITNLKNLKYLTLTECNEIKDISTIGSLKNLEGLMIENCNNIKDINPIFDISGLKALSLYLENIPDLSQIKKLENLEYFNSSVVLDKKLLNSLSNLKRLKKINIFYTAVNDVSPLYKLPDFEEIESTLNLHEKIYDIEIVKKLLENGADPNERKRSRYFGRNDDPYTYFLYGKTTPLTQSRLPEITELLIKYGARVNEQDEYGRTALMVSAYFDGYYKDENLNAKMLIKNGADVNLKNNGGQTALYIAAIGYNIASMKLLIANGADVNLRDNDGLSPLMAVELEYGRWDPEILEEITQIFINAGAVRNDADKQKIKRIIIDEEVEYWGWSKIGDALSMTYGDR